MMLSRRMETLPKGGTSLLEILHDIIDPPLGDFQGPVH